MWLEGDHVSRCGVRLGPELCCSPSSSLPLSWSQHLIAAARLTVGWKGISGRRWCLSSALSIPTVSHFGRLSSDAILTECRYCTSANLEARRCKPTGSRRVHRNCENDGLAGFGLVVGCAEAERRRSGGMLGVEPQ
jgi:hypothetical protein